LVIGGTDMDSAPYDAAAAMDHPQPRLGPGTSLAICVGVAVTYAAGAATLFGAYTHGFANLPLKEPLIAPTAGPAAKLAALVTLWQRHVLNPAASVDVDALTETVEAAMDVIFEFGPGALSLVGLKPEAVQGEHLATLLRASSSWRNQIPGWDAALAVDIEALRRAGTEPKDALFGMI
jgi:hypothetical protein